MTVPAPDLDRLRASVLDRIERSDRLVRGAILLAGLFELVLLVSSFMLIDWNDRLQRLAFVLAICGYTIVALGLVALAGHVSRVGDRVLAALEGSGAR